MSPEQAARLAERAARRRADGSRGVLARRAWDRLVRAGDRGDRAAAEEVLAGWLGGPDEERWAVLARWRGPSLLAGEVFAAAVEPGRDAAGRAAIGAFCVARGIVPEDAAARALFYLLTGQAAQYQAVDPDGRLLAQVYRAADEATRAALRDALAGVGGLDLVRAIADRGIGTPPMTAAERDYLVRQLAGRRAWAQLWRLALDLPVSEAVAAMTLFAAEWRPPDGRDRVLFERLARAEPELIVQAGDALRAPGVCRIEVAGTPVAGSFSPDGRQLAVADGSGKSGSLSFSELPGGQLLERYDYEYDSWFSVQLPSPASVLHLGSEVVAGWFPAWRFGVSTQDYGYLMRFAAGEMRPLGEGGAGPPARSAGSGWTGKWTQVAAHPAGFVALGSWPGDSPHLEWLRFCEAGGRVVGEFPFGPEGDLYAPTALATDPGSGRVAATTDGGVLIYGWDADGIRLLAQWRQQRDPRTGYAHFGGSAVRFLGPDRVAVAGRGPGESMWLFRLAADASLELEASRDRGWGDSHWCRDLLWIPQRGEIAVLDDGGGVRYVDARDLAPVAEPREFTGQAATMLCGSRDGRFHALGRNEPGGSGSVRVVLAANPAAGLAARPLAHMVPGDLAAVSETARYTADGAPFLELLRACLEHRFGAEVALGPSAPVIGDDEISL
jgi:hypothetical protein